MNEAYNIDCMEYMKTLPDNAFDLAVVDPPYGAGFTEGGGCKGWFTKYHQDNCSQSVNAERERERTGRNIIDSEVQGADLKSIRETGTKKQGKKSSLGTWPLEKIILMSFSAFPSIRSYGAVTTSNFHRRDASWYGGN